MLKGRETDCSGVKLFPKDCNLAGGQTFRLDFALFNFICIL